MSTAAVTDSSFEEDVLKSSVPVVVDFWAEWCAPCKALGTTLEEVSNEMGDQVKITKMNIEENQNIPTEYKVMQLPTLLLFKDGEVKAKHTGVLSKSKFEAWIKQDI